MLSSSQTVKCRCVPACKRILLVKFWQLDSNQCRLAQNECIPLALFRTQMCRSRAVMLPIIKTGSFHQKQPFNYPVVCVYVCMKEYNDTVIDTGAYNQMQCDAYNAYLSIFRVGLQIKHFQLVLLTVRK